MKSELAFVDSNVTLIAREFDLVELNHVWLYKKGLFTEDELKGNLSLPVHVEANSDFFKFILTQDRLTFSISPEYDQQKALINSKLLQFIKSTQHIRYTACGFNFIYHMKLINGDYGDITRSLFLPPDSKFGSFFDTTDSRFGGYFSMDVLESRLKLDAKPILKQNEEFVQFAYNFHINVVQDQALKTLSSFFKKWDKAKSTTNKINNMILSKG